MFTLFAQQNRISFIFRCLYMASTMACLYQDSSIQEEELNVVPFARITSPFWCLFSGQHCSEAFTRQGRDTSRLSALRSSSREPRELPKSSQGVSPQPSDEALKNIALPLLGPRPPSTHSRPGSRETVSGTRWDSAIDLRTNVGDVPSFFHFPIFGAVHTI